MNIDFEKGDGSRSCHYPKRADTGQVLMLGYMNAEAVSATQESGFVTFYSRSRNTLWRKGETSGNTLKLVDIKLDCDRDTLLVSAKPNGPTCHLETISCFGEQGPQGYGWLAELSTLIEARKTADPNSSYTASLLQGPLTRTAQKLGEEGVETVIAALAQTDNDLINESADLLYHLMVLLAAKDLNLTDIISELQNRRA